MQAGVSKRGVCRLMGMPPKTLQNWRREGIKDRRKGSARHLPHRLSAEEERRFYDTANNPELRDLTPEQVVATLADRGEYLGSTSTLYRIFRRRGALRHRQESKKPAAATARQRIEVTGPNQVWSWDITWLRTDVQGLLFYAYTIIDLYDRFIVGWSIEANESDEHARTLFERVIRELGVVPEIVHADNGNPMRGMTLAAFLDSLQVSRSYSRPRCSNDNAYIESWHKTLKYTVGYPSFFTSLERHAPGTPTSSTGTTPTTSIPALATSLRCNAAPERQRRSMRTGTEPSTTRSQKILSAGDRGKSGHTSAPQCSPSTDRWRRPLDDNSLIPCRNLS